MHIKLQVFTKLNNITALALVCLLSCGSATKDGDSKVQRLLPPTEQNTPPQNRVDSSAAAPLGGYALQDFYANKPELDKKVEAIFNAMSVEERAAQMIMPAVADNSYGMPIETFLQYYKAKKVGGVIFLRGTAANFGEYQKKIIAAANFGKITKPIISADAEPSLIHYKFKDVLRMTPTSQLKTATATQESANKILVQLRKAGVNTNFAPVVDNNSNKAIIGNRSFGSNGDTIVSLCGEFMKTHHRQNVATVIKHFPGHGNVKGDTHKQLVSIYGNLTEIDNFKRLIDAGALGVMVGHLAIQKNARWSTNGQASTLSRNIVTSLLRDSLGFKGLVYTDAMNMGAVSKVPNASFKAASAGIDIVLMPLNIDSLHAQIVKELNAKSMLGNQFTASIRRIIRMKICLGLI
ncbi:MAG: hypothetical protein RL660_793 [Bacteroidota bacterium]|jgi:beta-N-acetylhexosaminidase